jgi:transposase, IS5 family
MSQERFKRQEKESFFGNLIYDRIVPADHFLRKLDEVIPWERFTKRLVRLYKGRGQAGAAPWNPALVLKMLLIAYLYDISERQVEEVANFNLAVKYFLGLAADQLAPDHSTLTRFKGRLLERGKLGAFEELLAEVVHIAVEQGVPLGSIQVLDSVHSIANVNPGKDEGRQKRDGKPPRDGQARWGVKHTRRSKDAQGETVEQPEYFYGYKAHVSLNAETGLITSVEVTPGNSPDGKQLPALVEKDLQQGLPVATVAADRAYDDSANHILLESLGLHSALRLNAYRTNKKDANKEVWLRLRATPEYGQGQAERYKVERKFGEAKEGHGLRRCRYLGLLRYGVQAILTAITLNAKRLVKLLTGVPFKGCARLTVSSREQCA